MQHLFSAIVVRLFQVAFRAGRAKRGLPSTWVATRDANCRVKKRTPKVDSLLNKPGTTVRFLSRQFASRVATQVLGKPRLALPARKAI